jgi:hypothetical protein
MSIECAYSFFDLFRAAFKREPTIEEIAHFENLPQSGKNEMVKQWAAAAAWEAQDRVGTDGQTYTAFAPTFTPGKDVDDLSEYGVEKMD